MADILKIEGGVLKECADKSAASAAIPEGVTEIGEEAFMGCSSLSSVAIPASVRKIGGGAFARCESLSSAEFGGTVAQWEAVKGKVWLLEYIPATVVKCADGEWRRPAVLVEDGVFAREFDEGAKSADIPEGVAEIGEGAFYGCESLASVAIPPGVRKIGEGAFARCKSLSSVALPPSVTEIGFGAFDGCGSLSSAEFGGTVAQWESVKGKVWLLEYIPATVVKCADGEWRRPAVLVEDGVFARCFDKYAKSADIPEGITKIGRLAFYECSLLSSVSIPPSVTEIGVEAFGFCESLSSVVIPAGVAEIGGCAFYGCESLSSVVIPAGVTEIRNSAFARCFSLASVVIPPGVTKIGIHAFSHCSSLSSVVIPPSVTEIRECAFYGCESLGTIEFGGTAAQWEAVKKGDGWNDEASATSVKCAEYE